MCEENTAAQAEEFKHQLEVSLVLNNQTSRQDLKPMRAGKSQGLENVFWKSENETKLHLLKKGT